MSDDHTSYSIVYIIFGAQFSIFIILYYAGCIIKLHCADCVKVSAVSLPEAAKKLFVFTEVNRLRMIGTLEFSKTSVW